MKEKLRAEVNKYRKEGNKIARIALQTVLSTVQERENRENKELSESDIMKVIEGEKKKYVESAEAFAKVDDKDQVNDCNVAIELLDTFLPKKVEESDYESIADTIIAETEATSMRDMGIVMSSVKTKYGVAIDAGKMSSIVKEKLMQF